MKNFHEILDDVEIKENININELGMSQDEKQKILSQTLNKAGLINKKTTKKRFILPLAAAMTLVLSFAVVFAQGGLSSIYYKLFGENIKYINEMGTIIDKSYTSSGTVYNLSNEFGNTGTSSEEVTLNVAGMLGDENAFYIIFELIKGSGESFKDSDYIEFDTLRMDFKTSGGYTWYQIEDSDATDNKATFILSGNTKKKITGDKLNLVATDFTEYSIKEPSEGFNPYDFLFNNNDYINQSLIENNKEYRLPAVDTENNYSIEELNKINEIYNLTPNYVLPWKYSNIPVEENFRDIYVDNIGFADGKLCIRFALLDTEKHNIGDIYFVSKNNSEDIKYSEFVSTDEKGGLQYDYYIFDISDMEELKNYDLKYDIVSKLSTTKGSWEVNFKADYKNTTKTIKVNRTTEINNKMYTIKNIKISPIALNIEMNNNLIDTVEDPMHNFREAVSIIMDDGSTLEEASSGSSTNPLSSSINIMFQQPIDTTKIQKIKIGNIELNP